MGGPGLCALPATTNPLGLVSGQACACSTAAAGGDLARPLLYHIRLPRPNPAMPPHAAATPLPPTLPARRQHHH